MVKNKKNEQLLVDYYEEWTSIYKEGVVQKVTLQKYLIDADRLRGICPNLKICDLDRKAYQYILNEYGKTHEKVTTAGFHHRLKGCIKDMFYDGTIEKDPTYKCVVKGLEKGEGRNKKIKNKFLEQDELRKLLHVLDLRKIGMDWLVCILAKTGLRFAEAAALTPNDFDWANNTVSVNKTWNHKEPKGGFKTTKTTSSNRTITVDWQIVGQFKPLIAELPPNEPIFVEKEKNGRYRRIFNSTYNNFLERKCKQAGVPVISIHGLRHTHASVLLANGVSIQTISNRLGHADVTVTQEVYAHVLEELRNKDDEKMMSVLMQIA